MYFFIIRGQKIISFLTEPFFRQYGVIRNNHEKSLGIFKIPKLLYGNYHSSFYFKSFFLIQRKF